MLSGFNFRPRDHGKPVNSIVNQYPALDNQASFDVTKRKTFNNIVGNSNNFQDYVYTIQKIKSGMKSPYKTDLYGADGYDGEGDLISICHDEVVTPELFFVQKAGVSASNNGGTP